MSRQRRRAEEGVIIPPRRITLDQLREHLARWPDLWAVEPDDVVIGQCIVECMRPFALDLLQHGLADKTLVRHRDHLEMLGGEIIRRRYDDPDLAKKSAGELLAHLIDDEGGPLIWPRITESAQNAFDATCRKLYAFNNQQKTRD